MLHLFHAYFKKKYPNKKLQAIYIKEADPFTEVEEFIQKTEQDYDLAALNYQGQMKEALRKMLCERPTIQV